MDRLPPIRHPIYIVSKGRWERPLTARFLLADGIDFKIAVEPQEYENYLTTIPEKNILKLPFSNLGLGSYPARNACWEDSIKNGHSHHFLFDDNIYRFRRLNHGKRERCDSHLALWSLQEFTDRYKNVAISGYNYVSFATKTTSKPFYLNTHVYSGMLIRNDLPFRWRLKYNEDVDLCLQALHKKYCTILLNTFLIEKVSTTTKMKGGNQTDLYQNNSERKKMLKSKSLQVVWPEYVKVVKRFGRPHHQVSWSKFFKHPLKRIIDPSQIESWQDLRKR
jgi:hypothetical protein